MLRPREHNPPHFHAFYAGLEMTVNILTLKIDGNPPRPVRRMLLEWADLHRAELLAAWEGMLAGKIPGQIEPLS